MKIQYIFVLLAVCILAITNLPIQEADGQIAEISVYFPPTMITGETYQGVVTLSNSLSDESIILLRSSDQTIVRVPKTSTILPDSNIGYFPLTPLRQGNVTIFASVSGMLSENTAQIYSQKSEPTSLKIFLPINKTKAGNLNGLVYALDGKGAPIQVNEDRTITLSSSDGINTPNQVIIQKGNFYSQFPINVGGSGDIAVSSEYMSPHKVSIEKQLEDIQVVLEIAPDILYEYSAGFYFISLLKNGAPFNPPYVVDIQMSSSDVNIARMTESVPQHKFESSFSTSMINGLAHGRIFTSEPGAVTITASIANIGSDQKSIIVGQAEIIDSTDGNNEIKPSQNMDSINTIPNVVKIWAYPNPTSGKIWGVLAPYYINITQTQNTDLQDNATTLVNDDLASIIATLLASKSNFTSNILNDIIVDNTKSLIKPIRLDGRTIDLSSNGLLHPTSIKLSERNIITHAIEFDINTAAHGTYNITSSGSGLVQDLAEIKIIPSSIDEYELHTISLPTIPDKFQNLAIISVIDKETKTQIDLEQTFGVRPDIVVQKISDAFNNVTIIPQQNSWLVKGIIQNPGTLTISSAHIGIMESELIPAGIPVSVDLWIPPNVHISEPFPYVVHEIDIFGTPISKAKIDALSVAAGIKMIEGQEQLLTVRKGQNLITVLSASGAASTNTNAFSNIMQLSYSFDKPTVRVNEKTELDVHTVQGAKITVDTPIPYEKIGDTKFVFSPINEGVFDIIIKSEKQGYDSVEKTITLEARNEIDFKIVSTIEKNLPFSLDVKLITDDKVIDLTTPHNFVIKPSPMTITIPEFYESSGNKYKLLTVSINNDTHTQSVIGLTPNQNTNVAIDYIRMITIDITGAEIIGNNKHESSFPYGTIVTVRAEEKPILLFFIREVFDKWEGDPDIIQDSSVLIFPAVKNIYGSVSYRIDYTYLLLTIASIITGGGFALYVKKSKQKVDKTLFVNLFSDLTKQLNINLDKKKIDTNLEKNNQDIKPEKEKSKNSKKIKLNFKKDLFKFNFKEDPKKTKEQNDE